MSEPRPELLLQVSAAGRPWAVPLGDIDRVDRLAETRLDLHGPEPRILGEEDEEPIPLKRLDAWGEADPSWTRPGRRLLWLRRGGRRLGLLVDEVGGRSTAEAGLQALPPLPFADRPPIRGLSGVGEGALPVLDTGRLFDEPSDDGDDALDPRPPQTGTGAPGEPSAGLTLLPELPSAEGRPLVPALTTAQVLAVEATGSVLPLPGLPPWCTGVGWWQGRPLAVFDLGLRLVGRPTDRLAESAGRRLVAAVPGSRPVALLISGSCRPVPLPEAAPILEAHGSVAEAVHGLFQVGDRRIALLDLLRWIRA